MSMSISKKSFDAQVRPTAKSVRRKRSQVTVMPGEDVAKEKSLKGEILSRMPQVYVGNHLTRSWTREARVKSPSNDRIDENETGTPPPEQHYYFKITDEEDTTCCACAWFCRQSSPNNASLRTNNNNNFTSEKYLASLLAHKRVTPEDIEEWRTSFESLLANQAGCYMFRSFLESEIADENILFWLAVENLKEESKTKRLQKRIQVVYDNFISVYSPHEVNIDYKMREEIVEKIKEGPNANVFSAAQMQIYHLMHRDSYPRFVQTILTTELEQELRSRYKNRKMKNRRKNNVKNSPEKARKTDTIPEENDVNANDNSPHNDQENIQNNVQDSPQNVSTDANTQSLEDAKEATSNSKNSTGSIKDKSKKSPQMLNEESNRENEINRNVEIITRTAKATNRRSNTSIKSSSNRSSYRSVNTEKNKAIEMEKISSKSFDSPTKDTT